MEYLSTLTSKMEAERRARDFVEYVRCLAAAGEEYSPFDLLESRIGRDAAAPFRKAAVGAMDSTSGLLSAATPADWLAQVLKQTILGQLDGKLETVFNLQTAIVSTGATPAGWVAEMHPKPVAALSLTAVRLLPLKLSAIIVVSGELIKATNGKALALLDHQLRVACQRGEDALFLDNLPAVSQARPAGLLSGVSAVGTGAGDPGDIQALWDHCRSGAPDKPHFICSPAGAVILASRTEAMYRECSPTGTGRLMGVPLLCSPAAGSNLVLVDAGAIVVADGGIAVVPARVGAIAMDTDPQGSPLSGGGALTSLWASNQVGLRIDRYLNFAAAPDAVAVSALPVGSPY